jgi:DnaK suppressor protein
VTSKKSKAAVKTAPKAAKSAATSKSVGAKSAKVAAAPVKKAGSVAAKKASPPKPESKAAVKPTPVSKKPVPAASTPKSAPVAKTPTPTPTKPASKPSLPAKSAAPAAAKPAAGKSSAPAPAPAKPGAAKPVAGKPGAAVVAPQKIMKPAPKPVKLPPPPPPPPPVVKKKPGKGLTGPAAERMKQILMDRRASLLDRKSNAELASEDLGDSGGDSADRAAVSVDRDFMAESQVRDSKMLQDIDEALGKIAAGTYGVCEECGCTIALKRLEYLPFVAYCIECQEKLEEQGLYPDHSGDGPGDFRNVE